jgi:hypothetical protein
MNTNTNNDEFNDMTEFTPVQRKKSRFSNIQSNEEKSVPNAPIKVKLESSIDNSPVVMEDLSQPKILFKRKENLSAPNAPIKLKVNQLVDNSPIAITELAPLTKQILFTKKKEATINVNNTQLFPDLNQKKNTVEIAAKAESATVEKVDKPKTVWSSFKTSQLDTTKQAPILPSIVKQASVEFTEKLEKAAKIKASSSTDDSSYDEYDSDDYSEIEEYEETLLETLYQKHDDILDKLEHLEQNYRKNTIQYLDLERELADIQHEIDNEEYYEQQTENENYERLNQALYGNFDVSFYKEDHEVAKKRKEDEKKDEMRERKARIDILGYDDYDQFKLKLEEDLRKLRHDSIYKVY